MSFLPFRLSGLESLRIKETDRIAALKAELSKLGVHTDDSTKGELRWDGRRTSPMKQIRIATYHDHRMAMAFAPAALKNRPSAH
jgi:3-phosphoshikimate 1-carboxyvinyltransferase